jgi:DNA-binding transcriptional regulator YhcF (GntR family)
MKEKRIIDHINIDNFAVTPKYLQIANSILKAIGENKISISDVLPSINELSFELDISRDTAERGYRHLKSLSVIDSVAGKGYFIKNVDFEKPKKIFLLFNKLSAHKKIIYDAFIGALSDKFTVDFYIFNNNFSLFKDLIISKLTDYTHFIIIPHFIEGGEKAHEIINMIPKEKLILLDKKINGIKGEYSAVYENFEHDIYHALEDAKKELSKYETIKVIFPKNSYYPSEIITGVKKFCQDYAFNHEIVENIRDENVCKGCVYISLMEDDLVALLEKTLQSNLIIGKELGVISYNETPLKKILLNGITTISTDFFQMGEIVARLVHENTKQHIEVPFYLTKRASL